MDCGNAMIFGGPGLTPEENLIGAPKEGNEDKFMLLSASGFLDKDDVAGYMFHGDSDPVVPLWDPVACRTLGFRVHHQLQGLAQTHVHRISDAIQPS